MIFDKVRMVREDEALPGRADAVPVAETHAVNGNSLVPPFPDGTEIAIVGMGCFWGAEKVFWQLDGVFSTMVGYSGGFTPNPTYEEVCSGRTGHNEVVRIVFDPKVLGFADLMTVFFENHDPTQGMQQGNDRGSQYRSGVYCADSGQASVATDARDRFQRALDAASMGRITTEIKPSNAFYYAENYHQQYLAKNPQGYCGLGGTGVCMF